MTPLNVYIKELATAEGKRKEMVTFTVSRVFKDI